MKEPLSLRLSDCKDPLRGEKFAEVLDRRRASATDVLRALADAYIQCDGKIDFPVTLERDRGKRKPLAWPASRPTVQHRDGGSARQ